LADGSRKSSPLPFQGEVEDPAARQEVDRLRAADRKVRAHEAAHKTVGGPYAGPVSYQYSKGPDGKMYAVSGEVPIDTSPERTPEATITKMRKVRDAALAPADPSGQDYSVAAAAVAAELQARRELAAQDSQQASGPSVRSVNLFV
jgi:hypothetical protein